MREYPEPLVTTKEAETLLSDMNEEMAAVITKYIDRVVKEFNQ
jgi:uncharacterized phage infection (PIP) family protein YhgE